MERRGIQTAIGATMREAREHLDQVRYMVRDLRAGMAFVMERSGLSQALEKLRSVFSERDGLSAEKAGGVAGAMKREIEVQREHERMQALEKARVAEHDDYGHGL